MSTFKFQLKIGQKSVFVIEEKKRSWTLAFQNHSDFTTIASNLNRGNKICLLEEVELLLASWIYVEQKLKNEPMVFLTDISLWGNTYLHRSLEAILLVIHKVCVCKLLMTFLKNFHMIYILKKALKYKKHIRDVKDFKHYATLRFHLYHSAEYF